MSSHSEGKNKVNKGDAIPSIKVETSSLSTNDDEWTLTGSARTRTKSTTSTVATMDTTAAVSKFCHVTTHNFDKFQSKIFPIVQQLVKVSKSSSFKFCNEWIAALQDETFTFDANTSF